MINEVQTAEALLHSLHERNLVMEKALQEAMELQQGYQELLAALKANPPYIESQVKALEVEYELSEKQFQDLCTQRAKLQEEKKRLEGTKKQQLIERINYFRSARGEIQSKKKQVQKELRHLRETLGIRKARAKKIEQRNARKARKGEEENASGRKQNSDYDSDDSDDSKGSNEGEIPLNQQVISFLNAIVRKTNFNEPIIHESDQTLEDVKKRAAENEAYLNSRRSIAPTNSAATANNAQSSGTPASTASNHNSTQKAGSPIHHTHAHNGSSTPSNGKRKTKAATNEVRHSNPLAPSALSTASPSALHGTVAPSYNQRAQHPEESFGSPSSVLTSNSVALVAHSKGYVSQKTVLVNRRGRKHSQEQISFLKSLYPHANSDEKNLMQQLRQAFTMLFEKTEFTSIDAFLERYQQDQQLLENLRAQQGVVDARLAQLKQEHGKLTEEWNDITFSSEEMKAKQLVVQQSKEDSSNSSVPAGSGEEGNHATAPDVADNSNNNVANAFEDYGRFLDNQLFAKEVQLHHAQRIFDHNVHLMSEIRNAVDHIMSQLTMNSRLLAGLSRNKPPPLQTDRDIAGCVSWCEDMIIALNEALTMDTANRPNAGGANEDSKSIAERQMELAGLVHDMAYGKRRKRGNGGTPASKKEIGGLSKVLISSNDSFVTSPRNVLVREWHYHSTIIVYSGLLSMFIR